MAKFTTVSNGYTKSFQLPGFTKINWATVGGLAVDVVEAGDYAVLATAGSNGDTIEIDYVAEGKGVVERKLDLVGGVTVFPTTTSTAAGGWNVTSDTDISLGKHTFGGKTLTRFTAKAGTNYCVIRRKVQVNKLLLASGRIDIPVLIPSQFASGAAIQITISKDNPVGDPPTATPTNRTSFTFAQDNFKKGMVQVLSIHPNALASTSPNGASWVDVGTVTALDRYETLYFAIYCPIPNSTQSATNDNWFEIGDISFGASSTPTVILSFDGAGQDDTHVKYVLPLLNKYGWKAMFAVQGQIPTDNFEGTVERIKLIHEQGHDICNEGINHRNYNTNAALLLADVEAAKVNLKAIGVSRGVDTVFAAPQNSLLPGTKGITDGTQPVTAGVSDLMANGFKFIRSTSRRVFQPSKLGREQVVNVGALGTEGITAASLGNYIDTLELHGGTGIVLFHAIVPTVPGINQTALSEFTTFMQDLASRYAQGRINVMSATQFVAAYENLEIPS